MRFNLTQINSVSYVIIVSLFKLNSRDSFRFHSDKLILMAIRVRCDRMNQVIGTIFIVILLVTSRLVSLESIDTNNLPISKSLNSRIFGMQSSAFLALSLATIIDSLVDHISSFYTEHLHQYWLGRLFISLGFFYCGFANFYIHEFSSICGYTNSLPILMFNITVLRIASSSGFMSILNVLNPSLFSPVRTYLINVISCCLALFRLFSMGQTSSLIETIQIFQFLFYVALSCQLSSWFYDLFKLLISANDDKEKIAQISSSIFYLLVYTILKGSTIIPFIHNFIFNGTLTMDIAQMQQSQLTTFINVLITSVLFLDAVPARIYRLESILYMVSYKLSNLSIFTIYAFCLISTVCLTDTIQFCRNVSLKPKQRSFGSYRTSFALH